MLEAKNLFVGSKINQHIRSQNCLFWLLMGLLVQGGLVRLFSLTPYVSDFSCFFRCLPMLRYLFFYSSVCFLCVFVFRANLLSPDPCRIFSSFSSARSLMFCGGVFFFKCLSVCAFCCLVVFLFVSIHTCMLVCLFTRLHVFIVISTVNRHSFAMHYYGMTSNSKVKYLQH